MFFIKCSMGTAVVLRYLVASAAFTGTVHCLGWGKCNIPISRPSEGGLINTQKGSSGWSPGRSKTRTILGDTRCPQQSLRVYNNIKLYNKAEESKADLTLEQKAWKPFSKFLKRNILGSLDRTAKLQPAGNAQQHLTRQIPVLIAMSWVTSQNIVGFLLLYTANYSVVHEVLHLLYSRNLLGIEACNSVWKANLAVHQPSLGGYRRKLGSRTGVVVLKGGWHACCR